MPKSQVKDLCKDEKPNACKNYYKNKCNSQKFAVFVKTNCKATCGFCDIEATSGRKMRECMDMKPKKCRLYGKSRCGKPKFKKLMKQYCPKTCGTC